MILFISSTLREMESFVKGRLSSEALRQQIPVENYQDREIGFLVCGVGLLNAAISLERFLAGGAEVCCAVNIGIAGSYDPQLLPLGSVCVADREIWPEYGVRNSGFIAEPEKLGFPLDTTGLNTVWNSLDIECGRFSEQSGFSLDPDWHQGTSITLAGISSGPEQALELKTRFNADMENMEGFALAYCCYLRSIPFLEIRTISNVAGSRNKDEWDFKGAFKALGKVWTCLWEKQDGVPD